MNAKEFKEEILNHYLDEDYQVTIDRDPGKWSTGNGLLHTSLFYTILHLNNLIEKDDIERFSKAVDLCWESTIEKPIVGILERNDAREDLEAHDNYHIVTASFLLDTYHAKAIAHYGDLHMWSFNNENPHKFTFRTWHERLPGQVGYYQLAGRIPVSCIHGYFLKFKIGLDPSDHQDSCIKDYLKCQVMLKSNEQFQKPANQWLSKSRYKWGDLGNICKGYFGENHPLSKIPTIGGKFNE